MSRGKNCLPTVSRQFLTRNYPTLSPKMPPKLSLPHKRGLFILFQNWPRGEGNCETSERQKLSRGNLCPATSICLFWPTGCAKSLTFFRAPAKKDFPFFLWGDLVQNRTQNPAPAGCLFSTRKSRSEVPERGDFGEDNCLGKGGRTGQEKKKEKGCTQKGGKWGSANPRKSTKKFRKSTLIVPHGSKGNTQASRQKSHLS